MPDGEIVDVELIPARDASMRENVDLALKLRERGMRGFATILDDIDNWSEDQEEPNWLADTFHKGRLGALADGQWSSVKDYLKFYVDTVNMAGKAGQRDRSDMTPEELQLRLKQELARAAQEDPNGFRRLLEEAQIPTSPTEGR